MTNAQFLISRNSLWTIAQELRKSSKKQKITVVFLKADYSFRKLTGMLGVKMETKGNARYNAEEKLILTFLEGKLGDLEAPNPENIRNVRLDRIVSVRIDGKDYVVKDDLTEDQISKFNNSLQDEMNRDKVRKNLKKLSKTEETSMDEALQAA